MLAAVPKPAPPAPRRPRSRVGLVAAAASVLLHLLLFALIRVQLVSEPRATRPPVQAYQLRPAMQAYHIAPVYVAPGQVEPVLPPRRELLIDPRLPVPPLALPPVPAAGGSERVPSLGERLGRTPTADLELWRPVTPGSYERPLTEDQKNEIAEVRKTYSAKLAQEEILFKSKVAGVFEYEARQALQDNYRRDVERLTHERDRKIEKIRSTE